MEKFIITFIFIISVFFNCTTEYCATEKNTSIHKIIFKNVNGATNLNASSFDENVNFVLKDATRSNAIFKGWFDAEKNGKKVTGWRAGDFKKDVTLWAIWVVNGIEEKSGDFIINGKIMQKSSMIKVLNFETNFKCDQEKGAFINGRKTVRLSPFYIGKYEVTQQLFTEVMKKNPSKFKEEQEKLDKIEGYSETNVFLRPIDSVNWYHAIAFCNKLSILLEKTPCYNIEGISDWSSLDYSSIPYINNSTWDKVTCDNDADGYRLPTEAEWECAARGGMYDTTIPWTFKFSGSDTKDSVSWNDDNSNLHVWEVGLKTPNTLGIYDMSGNLWEWCWDWVNPDNDITKSDNLYTTDDVVLNPAGPKFDTNTTKRVIRGGAYYFHDIFDSCTVDNSSNSQPETDNSGTGFRLVQNIK